MSQLLCKFDCLKLPQFLHKFDCLKLHRGVERDFMVTRRSLTHYKSFPYYLNKVDKADFRWCWASCAEFVRLSLDIFFSESSTICVS